MTLAIVVIGATIWYEEFHKSGFDVETWGTALHTHSCTQLTLLKHSTLKFFSGLVWAVWQYICAAQVRLGLAGFQLL